MYFETFKNLNDLSLFDNINYLYVCKHFGTDKNGLEINEHYHVISLQKSYDKYSDTFTFSKEIKEADILSIKKYCENKHCNFEVLVDLIDVESYEVFPRSDLNDLIEEIVYNSENNIVKPHSYYLKRYGKAYLFNFKKLREIFDSSSDF